MGKRRERETEADLRKQVQTLQRQLARAHREIARLQGLQDVPEPEESPAEKSAGKCPKCGGGPLVPYVTPSKKTVTTCRNCKHRIGHRVT